MNIVDKIKRRLIYERDKRSIFKTFKDKGGRLALNTKLSIQGTFSVGRNVVIQSEGIDNITRSQIVILPGALLEIDDNVGMTQISITCKNYIHIGSNVKIGAGTMIYDTNFHNTDWQVRRNHEQDLLTAKNAPVVIEDDVFIVARSIIGKGVTIGARTIIAAGSVVVKGIPADCIAGGNPCQVIKQIL